MRTDFAGSGRHDTFNPDGTVTPGLTPEAHLAEVQAQLAEASEAPESSEQQKRISMILDAKQRWIERAQTAEVALARLQYEHAELESARGRAAAALAAAERKLTAVENYVKHNWPEPGEHGQALRAILRATPSDGGGQCDHCGDVHASDLACRRNRGKRG